MRFGVRPHHPRRSRSPDLDLFVIRRSQTTDGEIHIVTMEFAGETRSDACMASEGPRATKKNAIPLTVGRGPVPRHRSRTPTFAGDRPPRYGKKRFLNHRGGQAPALRKKTVLEPSRGKPARMRVWKPPRAPALREHRAPRSLLRGSQDQEGYCIETGKSLLNSVFPIIHALAEKMQLKNGF